MSPRAALTAACAAAAFASLTRLLGLWTGDITLGAGLAVACAAAGLAASFLLAAPGPDARPWWCLAAALSGPALAVWTRLAGLSASDPAYLGPAATPLLPLLAPAAAAFFFLGRAARGARAGLVGVAQPPLATLAACAALERVEAPLVLALATPALLLAVPARLPALAGLALAAACGWNARAALRDAWTLRLDHLYAGWTWLAPPAGAEGLGLARFPDGRVASLRAGRLTFEDADSARLAMLAVLGQCVDPPTRVVLARPRNPSMTYAARAADLATIVVDPSPQADGLLAAIWSLSGTPLDPAWKARRSAPGSPPADLLMIRVPGRGRRAERSGLADARALRAWRRTLRAGAPAGVLFAADAAPADVAATVADAASVFGHVRVADLPAGVLVLASPAPVATRADELVARLTMPVRVGWDPAPALEKGVRWRPEGPGK